MKKFMKFIPVALGMLMLASCSNDDFFGDNTETDIYANLGDGDMVVNAPIPRWGDDALTRGLRDFVPGGIPLYYFQVDDKIRVYDNALTKYDIYEYRTEDDQSADSKKKFRRRQTSNLDSAPTYVLYPKEDIIQGIWEYTNEGGNQTHTVATVNISGHQEYVTGYDRDADDECTRPLYLDILPQFGSVTTADKGYLEAKMEYLTAILCFQMNGDLEKYAAGGLKVQLIDRDGNPLQIAGQFTTELAVNNKIKLAYKEVGGKTIVDEEKTARITYDNLVNHFGYDVVHSRQAIDPSGFRPKERPGTAIYVDLDYEKDGLSTAHRPHAKVFVPLVCTDVDHTLAKIVVSINKGDGNGFVPVWTYKDENGSELVEIERGKYYYNTPEYNLAIDGGDACAVSDALELLSNEVEGKVILTAKNPIQINSRCKRIRIPNVENEIEIDLSNGVFGATDHEQLILEYENEGEGLAYPSSVKLIGARPEDGEGYPFALDVHLNKGVFTLVNKIENGGMPVQGGRFDATSLVLGDGKTRTWLNGSLMALSDNVQSLVVAEKSALVYDGSDYSPITELVVPIPDEDVAGNEMLEGYQNKGLKTMTVNGFFGGNVDAKNAALNVTVQGDDDYFAVLMGGIRTQGTITAPARGILYARTGREGGLGFAAYGNVTVQGQSFIAGPVLSKNGSIIIANEDLNPLDLLDAGELSDVVYETIGSSEQNLWALFGMATGYGPLYAEHGSVKLSAVNSTVLINNKTNASVPNWLLAEIPQKAKNYSVYAEDDIEMLGQKITINGSMWAQDDVTLGNLKEEGDDDDEITIGEVLAGNSPQIEADHDFVIEGKSYANQVVVGHKATVNVEPQDGLCGAVGKLFFTHDPSDENELALLQGYVQTVFNKDDGGSIPVALSFNSEGAFASIGYVADPDNLIPVATTEGTSVWNGKQMPESMKHDYLSQTDVWTATQLATQLVKGINGATLRANIDLKDFDWPGINTGGYSWSFNGNGKRIKNLKITGHGFYNTDLLNLTVKDLTLFGVETAIPAQANLTDVGALAGKCQDATLTRVIVVLDEDKLFGSDGKSNLQATNIGGVLGNVTGSIFFTGVRINGQGSKVSGWAGIGGLVGKVAYTVDIKDAPAEGNFKAEDTHVNKLGLNVTYLATPANGKVNDLEQGKTGLYIGTVDLTNKRNITIVTKDSPQKAWAEVSGAADESKAFNIESANDRFYFIRGDQSLIGQCGFQDPVDPNSGITYTINGKLYPVWKEGMTTTASETYLYKLFDEVHANQYWAGN